MALSEDEKRLRAEERKRWRTIAKLKKEAIALGYELVKFKPLRCPCGAKADELRHGMEDGLYYVECIWCRLHVRGDTDFEAMVNRNRLVREIEDYIERKAMNV